MNPAAPEIVAIVDEHNRAVSTATRSRMRRERLLHRATYVLVFDRCARVLLQRRTETKDLFAGFYDVAAGGVVLAGESYEESAAREAGEELGICGVAMTVHSDFLFEDPHTRTWGRIFSCVHEGPFRLQPEEVVSVRFVETDAVLAGRHAPVTPDTLEALRRYLEEDR